MLLRTGWSDRWGTDAYGANDHPYLSEAGTEALVAAGVALVGIDALNIDSTVGNDRPAHSGLLAAGIPIVEHLTGLAALPTQRGPLHRRAHQGGGPGDVRRARLRHHRARARGGRAWWSTATTWWRWAGSGRRSPAGRSDPTPTTGPPSPRRSPTGVVLAFQRVPEDKQVKNRLHLDIRSADIEADTRRAVGLGASPIGSVVTDDVGRFQVLADPEGNEFCFVG